MNKYDKAKFDGESKAFVDVSSPGSIYLRPGDMNRSGLFFAPRRQAVLEEAVEELERMDIEVFQSDGNYVIPFRECKSHNPRKF